MARYLVALVLESLIRLLVYCAGGLVVSSLVAAIASTAGKLNTEREKLRVMLASIDDAVIGTDIRGRGTFMNAAAEEATGWSASDGRGAALEEVFHIVDEKTRARLNNPIQKVFTSGRTVGLANHTLLIRRDRTELAVDDRAAPVRDSSGNIVGAILVFRDVTSERKAQAALLNAKNWHL